MEGLYFHYTLCVITLQSGSSESQSPFFVLLIWVPGSTEFCTLYCRVYSLSVCVSVCVCVCVQLLLVNKIPAERMYQFGRGFRYMVAYRTGSDPIEIGDPGSKVKIIVTENVFQNNGKKFA